ncbi:MAG: hypothetical protein AAFW98_11685 [Pseudomonadota bacterium]
MERFAVVETIGAVKGPTARPSSKVRLTRDSRSTISSAAKVWRKSASAKRLRRPMRLRSNIIPAI